MGHARQFTCNPTLSAEAPPIPRQGQDGADVYIVDAVPKPGPWTVRGTITPDSDDKKPSGFQAHTLLIEVTDTPGVLNEVTGVIARRGYNIQSLAVGNSENPGCSRITTVLPGQEGGVSKLIKQIEKLVVVIDVKDLTGVPHVARELMLVKVCTVIWCHIAYLMTPIFISPSLIPSVVQFSNLSLLIRFLAKSSECQCFRAGVRQKQHTIATHNIYPNGLDLSMSMMQMFRYICFLHICNHYNQ
jgi:acetolactate synthase small subunit